MTLLACDIPEGVSWADYFEIDSVKFSSGPVNTVPEENVDDGWEVVGTKKVTFAPIQPKWCKHGNACVWRNCPYRHERCAHHDKWIASGKKTRPCRHLETDPESCKNVEDGGCKYDHRDVTKLRTYYKSVPAESEKDIWEAFYARGLEACLPNIYETKNMDKFDRHLLIDSLVNAKVWFETHGDWFEIRTD